MNDEILRPGRVLRGKWQLDKRLGRGGMATVFSATHRNGLRGAVKILHPELARDRVLRARLRQEGYVANRVKHPGIVRVLDDDVTEDGIVFLVMELLEGETLRERWASRDRNMSVEETLPIAIALLDILTAAHAAGVLHRDIKPDNVFLTSDGGARLLDFGIARVKELNPELTLTGTTLGTPAFMSPEQALAKWDEVDARSDLFGLAATVFTLLTGRLIHVASTVPELLVLTSTTQVDSLATVMPSCPPAVAAVIDKALRFAKADRYASATQMRDALIAARLASGQSGTQPMKRADSSLLAGPPSAATQEPPTLLAGPMASPHSPSTDRPPRGSRRWVLAAGMLAVAGASTWTVAAIKSHVNKAPGSATSTTPPLPTASAAQSGCIARVEAGPRSTCAIRNDGNVYCWGSNTSGLFAPKGAATLPRPTPLAGIRSPVALALGARVAFAIVDEGLFGWGESFSGVLGQSVPVGEHRSSDNSVTVFPAGVTSVAVEGLASNIACAVRGREVLCWGGQSTSLNLPLTMEAHPAPVKIALPPDPLGGTMRVIGVSPLGFACARSEAFLWCWGNQQMTKMQPKALPNDLPWGFGTFSSGDVAEGEGAVGGEAVCSDSACIGGNVNCDLGNGAPSDDVTTTPQSVGRPLASIHSGGSFFCGLLDGDVLCWGNNLAGQILQGEARICRPHKAGLPKAKSIALGSAHSCVVTLAGEVYCRGDNKAGQRGCEPDATGACRVDVPCD